tara:strand:- start:49 stop:1065 length:1017 start_codon:yes stop_codon:yes gene_type:complete
MNSQAVIPSPKARFVVGTGRCGSTLLSKMLTENADVLSVYEMFSGIDYTFRFRTDAVCGKELAKQLLKDHPVMTMTIRRGYDVPEVAYPFQDPTARYKIGDAVPWMLGIAIPQITDKPEELFDELITRVEKYPMQSLAIHYREILDWLAFACDKQCWIERSGTSIEYLPELVNMFPDAKFLHIHRDGREAALSMREYPSMRVGAAVIYGLLGDMEFSNENIMELERKNPAAIDDLLEIYPPLELFGRYWSDQIQRGYTALEKISSENYYAIKFEDLVTDTQTVIAEVVKFLEIEEGPWIDNAAALVNGMPYRRFSNLNLDEQILLEKSCEKAMQLIGR